MWHGWMIAYLLGHVFYLLMFLTHLNLGSKEIHYIFQYDEKS